MIGAEIVVIGGNMGGIAAARALSRRHRVTVFDPAPDFEFLPNIHELLSGVKRPVHLRLARKGMVARGGHRFRQAAIRTLSPATGRMTTDEGEELAFDGCIVACGGVNATFSIPGVAEHAIPFKCVDDCAQIGQRLRELDRAGGGTVLIIGGGLEGVEALGEILRRYGHAGFDIHLVEAGSKLLPASHPAIGKAVTAHCAAQGVTLHLNAPVKRIGVRRVALQSGTTLNADLVIWTAGAAPSPLLHASGLAPAAGAWAPVRATLQSRDYDNVYVVGDGAEMPEPIAKQAYHALAMGELAAQNLERWLDEKPQRAFRPAPDINLIAFGDLDTYLQAGRRVLAGPALAPAKEAIYQVNMARLDGPLRPRAMLSAQARYLNALRELGLPALRSPRALLRAAGLRLLA